MTYNIYEHRCTSQAPSELALKLTTGDGSFSLHVLDVVRLVYRCRQSHSNRGERFTYREQRATI